MRRLLIILDKINEVTGSVVSWFSAVLVLIICMDVAMRYLFDFTLIWIINKNNNLFIYLSFISYQMFSK
jgi:TRAP-type mannitol/chloroaromatic compound transport system permease small subunit